MNATVAHLNPMHADEQINEEFPFRLREGVSQTAVNSFRGNALAAVHDLLDGAVSSGDGLSPDRAWLVQVMLRAADEAEAME